LKLKLAPQSLNNSATSSNASKNTSAILKSQIPIPEAIVPEDLSIKIRHCGLCHDRMLQGHKNVCEGDCTDYSKCLYLKGHPDVEFNFKKEKQSVKKGVNDEKRSKRIRETEKC